MSIKNLNKRAFAEQKTEKVYLHFQDLLEELKTRDLPENMIDAINLHVDQLNSLQVEEKNFAKEVVKRQNDILLRLEKELKIVSNSHYKTTWVALGMTAFGLPMGVAFGISLGNMAYLALGLPIGLAIGNAYGNGLDQKAAKEGRQLNWKK